MKTFKVIIAAMVMLTTSFLFCSSRQDIKVSGTVSDETGAPLHGATVTVKGSSTLGVVTGIDGRFTIDAAIGQTLVVSFLGYEAREVEITGQVVDVVLVASKVLMEVIVTKDHSVDRKQTVTGGISRSGNQAEYSSHDMSLMRVSPAQPSQSAPNMYYPGGEEYGSFRENKFIAVSNDPLSTFSLDVDGASYSNVRRMLNSGQKPVEDAVRVEEMINYFSYDYAKPTGSDPVKINYEVGPCPWNSNHRLVRIGVKAREIDSSDLPPTNFVYLIDVSGSMYGRLDLVKSSFKLLVNNLRPIDKVSIVVYAGEVGIKLPATPGTDKQKINEVIDGLRAGGGTAGGAGIQTAYRVARENFITGGNNRIILATDGDFNVGASSIQDLERLIVRERESGVFLTVLGYGMGNYKDKMVQNLAEKGNGNHAYIDNMQEAHKVLVKEFGGTMHTVAKDVKLQVEFNPARVQSYRLVGYESRLLEHEDFNNDLKDAGELGVGHTVTALYEIVPAGVQSNVAGTVDPLKYQPGKKMDYTAPVNYSDELMTVKLRYKDPDKDTSKLMEVAVKDSRGRNQSEDFHFASAVAMFGQLLRGSEFKGDANYDLVVSTARKGLSNDEYGYRHEFIRLAEAARAFGES